MEKYAIMLKQYHRNNDYGFTMLNFLFAFSLFLLVVSFFPILLKSLAINCSKISYDVDLFFEHIGMEIVEARELSVSGTTLFLSKHDGKIVSFEKYNQNIRRRVNGAGNEILIQGVDEVSYQLVHNGVIVTIKQKERIIEKRLSLAPIVILNNYLEVT